MSRLPRRSVSTLWLVAPFVLFTLLGLFGGSFRIWSLAATTLFALVALWPGLRGRRWMRRVRIACLLLGPVVGLMLAPRGIRELTANEARLARLLDEGGVARWSSVDRVSVYALGLAMSVGGLVAGFPAVAREQLLLAWPGPALRELESDFALEAEPIRRPLARFASALEHGATELPPRRIAFSSAGRIPP